MREIADDTTFLLIEPGGDELDEVVLPADDSQRAVAGVGELRRRLDDAAQDTVQVEVGRDRHDRVEQRRGRAGQIAEPGPGRRGLLAAHPWIVRYPGVPPPTGASEDRSRRGTPASQGTAGASRAFTSTTAQPSAPTRTGLRSISASSGTSHASMPTAVTRSASPSTSAAGLPAKARQERPDPQRAESTQRIRARDRRHQQTLVTPELGRDPARCHPDEGTEPRVAHDAERDLGPGHHALDQDLHPLGAHHLADLLGCRSHLPGGGESDPDQSALGLCGRPWGPPPSRPPAGRSPPLP